MSFGDDFARDGNLIEAVLWFVIAVTLTVRSIRSEPRYRAALAILSMAFLIFGVSDLIEAGTGAWWRPWWLLGMKGACLLAIVCGFRLYYQARKNG